VNPRSDPVQSQIPRDLIFFELLQSQPLNQLGEAKSRGPPPKAVGEKAAEKYPELHLPKVVKNMLTRWIASKTKPS